MIWGLLMHGWIGQLVSEAADPFAAEVEFMASHGLKACHWSAMALMEMPPDRREMLSGLLHQHDVRAALHVGFDYLSHEEDEIKRGRDQMQEAIEAIPGPFRSPIMTTAVGRYHRFMRQPSLDEQLDRLAELLHPLAKAAHGAGCPLGIENHADYYCSDLVALCRRVPHLGIFLDTGNCLFVGEKPLPAAMEAAPYTIGTHFKDEFARPEPGGDPSYMAVNGAVPGSGDVELGEIYEILRTGAPDPDRLAMILELDPVKGMSQADVLAGALAFVRGLEA